MSDIRSASTTLTGVATAIEEPRPRFGQIADVLRDRIQRGVYAPGSPLPSEPELSREFAVSRVTANRAVTLLRAEGLVLVRRGRGAFVRTVPVITRRATTRFADRDRGRGAYDVELRELGLEPTYDVRVERVPASENAARLLGVDVGAELVVRRRRFYADGEPVQLADSYLPAELAEKAGVDQPETGQGGTYSRLAEAGRAPVHFVENVTCRAPSAREASFLRIEQGQPVLDVLLVAADAKERPVSVTQHVMAGQQWKLRYEWTDDSFDA
jgi:GntR family transcriptional regulator